MSIKEFIYNLIWPEEQVMEMATVSKDEKWGNNHYKIAVHGTATGDRENPHIHIYLSNDMNPYNEFNFEISLTDILCYDEINLIYQRDIKAGKKITSRNKCSWTGYSVIKSGFEEWLFEPCKYPGNFKDNLDCLIWTYNNESDNSSENAVLDYINKHGLKISDKYMKYFE